MFSDLGHTDDSHSFLHMQSIHIVDVSLLIKYFHIEGSLKFFSNFHYHKQCYTKHICISAEYVPRLSITNQKSWAFNNFYR